MSNDAADQRRQFGDTTDEFTGDPRIRDLWETSRHDRHGIIRSMHGDLWSEATLLGRFKTVVGYGLLWLMAVLFLWAGLGMVSVVGLAVIVALLDVQQPVEVYLGSAGTGGLADLIVGGTLLLSVLCVSHAIWSKLAARQNEIRRLRGLSNTELLRAFDRWRDERARAAEMARRESEAWERRREADYLAERIGEETREAVYRAGVELEKYHDFSERIAGRRR